MGHTIQLAIMENVSTLFPKLLRKNIWKQSSFILLHNQDFFLRDIFFILCKFVKVCLKNKNCFPTADTPLAQVKVGEITSWLARREKSPRAAIAAISRAWWRWNHKYVQPKRAGIAPAFQIIVGSMIFFYAINYGKISKYKTSSRLCAQSNVYLPFYISFTML